MSILCRLCTIINVFSEVQDHGQVRDRPKYPTIQTFKGRKSNSLMNLYGKRNIGNPTPTVVVLA